MRYIQKNNSPLKFDNWKSKYKGTDWKKLRNPLKNVVLKSLLAEQGSYVAIAAKRLMNLVVTLSTLFQEAKINP